MRSDWIKIKNYYLHHTISLEELAKRYKVSVSAVNEHCRLEKWVEAKKKKQQEIERKLIEKTTNSEIEKRTKANELHNELYNKGLEVANMLLDGYLSDLKQNKKKTKATAYNLDFVMKAIANAQKGQRTALNIDSKETNNVEPEIAIIEGVNIDKI